MHHLGQYVLKRLRDANRLNRFAREVEVVQSLDHPNVVKIIDHQLDQRRAYLVMEYCASGDLDRNREPWLSDLSAALELFQQVCEGLAVAHSRGIVHRDIKPANILLRSPSGPAVVADFGIAYIEDDPRLTRAGQVMGPRGFTAPELERGLLREVPASADVYSLGKLLYWLLSDGSVVAREEFRSDLFNLVRLHREPRLEHINRLLDDMIVAEPAQRLSSATEVLARLRTVIRVIEGGYNAPSGAMTRVAQLCTYCGQGTYKLVARGNTYHLQSLRYIEAPEGSAPDWRVLVCVVCGHVQHFRIEAARRKDWWEEQD